MFYVSKIIIKCNLSIFQMPKLNQNPAPGQPFELPKNRQISTIPKAKPDEEGPFWIYPSQQV